MSTELYFLALTALLSGVLWIPSVVGQVKTRGFLEPSDYQTLPTSQLPDWALRANRAHINAVENLSTFAAIVIISHLVGHTNQLTVICAEAFFFARLAHAAVFIAGFKHFKARTVIFSISWTAFLVYAASLLLSA